MTALNVLVVATKAPWPPIDGGRFLLKTTLEGLAAAGCRTTLVAPVDSDPEEVSQALSPWCVPRLVPAVPLPLARALLRGGPLSIARHSLAAVRREVERLLAAQFFDLVHAEQLQALPQMEAAAARGIPVVLRAQNVESDLWAAAARRERGIKELLLRREAKRLADWEGRAVRRTAATLALTGEDAARLRELSGREGNVKIVPAPFPDLPPGTGTLPGEPAVVVFGSRGWLPNEEAAAWFHHDVWPAVRAELPGAILHLFGMDLGGPGVVPHPAPKDSGEAFAPGSILVVPLRIASGVRIKILEAWARGVPVVATPAALAGLDAEEGREALMAKDARELVEALSRLYRNSGLRERVVQAGQRARRERHDPEKIADRLIAEYQEVLSRRRA